MKKLNKLSLSLVVGSLLFTQSYALPSGGISVSGGFNIASDETVNFRQGKTNQNYLNIVYGSKSSHYRWNTQ